MKKINIMILTHSLHVGGAENHVNSLVLNSDKAKFNFVIVCLYELGVIGERLSKEKDGIKVYHNLMRRNFDVSGVWKLIHIMRGENINILYIVLTPFTLFWGAFCAKIAGVKASLARSTTIYPIYRVTKKRKIITSVSLNFIDKIIAQSNSHKDYLVESAGFDPGKIIVIYNGVDLECYGKYIDMADFKFSVKIPTGAPVIGIVGRLVPEKGHLIFLRAARRILESFPQAHFLIAGDGKQRSELETFSNELRIDSNVHFLGTRHDISQILSLLNVAVMSSVTEAFSNAILEYMAASKPVVATDAGSNAEIVVDGDTGYVVPCNDSEAMADAVLKLLRNEKLAIKMGETGRATVIEKFTIQDMIAKYESLFIDLVEY